jgi:hypothetical protein
LKQLAEMRGKRTYQTPSREADRKGSGTEEQMSLL